MPLIAGGSVVFEGTSLVIERTRGRDIVAHVISKSWPWRS